MFFRINLRNDSEKSLGTQARETIHGNEMTRQARSRVCGFHLRHDLTKGPCIHQAYWGSS